VGEALYTDAQAGTTPAHVVVDATATPNTEVNVIAGSSRGRKGRTIVVGAHLDSVEEGPGINDNGSGSSAILEIAEEIAQLPRDPRNRLRFAFWGAEEAGLVGSTAYVNELVANGQIGQIEANLNFDMVGSPNFVRFVYDGDLSDSAPPPSGAPAGSAQIEQLFLRATSARRDSSAIRRRSTGAPTTARSSRTRSRPAACSPARRGSRPSGRKPSTAASPAWRTTPAITRRATRSST
jgi:Zn-dependent M28 family amino/carboxypeptidase